MPLQVGSTRGCELRRHAENHCTGAGQTLSEEESCEPPMVPKRATVRRTSPRHVGSEASSNKKPLV